MRLGKNVVVDGVTYAARFDERNADAAVGLFVRGSEPQPDGFEWDDRGLWFARTTWSRVQEAWETRAWARIPGRWVVELDRWDEDGVHVWVTHFDHWQDSSPFDRNDEPPRHPPYLDHQYYYGYSQGTVAIADLTDVREIRRDVAIPGQIV